MEYAPTYIIFSVQFHQPPADVDQNLKIVISGDFTSVYKGIKRGIYIFITE